MDHGSRPFRRTPVFHRFYFGGLRVIPVSMTANDFIFFAEQLSRVSERIVIPSHSVNFSIHPKRLFVYVHDTMSHQEYNIHPMNPNLDGPATQPSTEENQLQSHIHHP
jgi:hypothetical protein